MTRILILASYAPSLPNFRGALIDELCQRGHEVHVAAPGLATCEATISWLGERNVFGHDITLSRSGLNPVADLVTLLALTRLMRRVRPDLLLGYTIKPVVWGLISASLARVPGRVALITGLGYAFTGEAGGLRGAVRRAARTLYRISLKRATLVLFQNPDDQQEFCKLGLLSPRTPSAVVAGSGVDTDHFSLQPLPLEPIRFLLIARLLGDKGIREYVQAARRLRSTGAKAEFHLVGGADPSPDGIPEEEVMRWHDAGHIIWHGHISDVRDVMANTSVYVLPSYREGMPRTVLEAMSMGRPIITTDAPGCRETVIEGENGFLVPVRDSKALADSMLRFTDDTSLVQGMGLRSREIAIATFDVHKVNAAMLSEMGLK